MEEDGLFILVFNPILYSTMVNESISLFDYLDYPVFTYLVDYPYYHIERLNNVKSDKIYLSCVDYNHIAYLNRYHRNIKNVVFLPHFGFKSEDYIPYEQREIDLYFPGSYVNPKNRLKDINELPEVLAHIAKTLISEMIKCKNLTLDEALTNYLDSIQFAYDLDHIPELINVLLCVDQYLRDYYRHNIITEILNSGISLMVSGTGWSELKTVYPNLLCVLSEGVDIEENISVIANSKILLNILPSFKNGTHERIFTAMMNGCICLTNENQFLIDNYKDNDEIVYYDINYLENLPDIIRNLLNNPQESKKIAEQGREKVRDEYGFTKTAKQILTIMGCE
jgi:hypothetical protein